MEKNSLQPFAKNSGSASLDAPDHLVLEHIRSMIADGSLKPGMNVPSERMLSESLGISRGYVRKAISTLEHYGIVKVLPHRGTIVAAIGGKAILSLIASIGALSDTVEPLPLFDMRRLLEGYSARMAARRASKEEVGEIMRYLAEFKEKAEAGAPTLENDHLFHLSIARASGNPVCIALQSFITPQINAMYADYAENDPNRFRHILNEHDAIAKAIVEKDEKAAELAMEAHIVASIRRRLPNLSDN